jgi:hypothetical protein
VLLTLVGVDRDGAIVEDDDVVAAELGGGRGMKEAGVFVPQAAHSERVVLPPVECQRFVGR